MNVRALVPLIAGLGIGGLALALGINTLKNAQAAKRPAPKVKIWAAKEEIPRGVTIAEEMLQEVAFGAEAVPKGAFQKKEELVGRVPRLVAPAGLPVLEEMLCPPGTKAGIFVKQGYRAVAVKIDAGSGVDFHLEPGSYVDVVASFKVKRDGRAETIAKTIVENAEIAAVGPRISPTTGSEADAKDKGRAVRAVTLFVKHEDAKKLLLAEQQGRIKLCLRGEADSALVNDEQVVSDGDLTGVPRPEPKEEEPPAQPNWLEQFLAAQRAFAAARPSGPPPWELRIYRGKQEELLRFKNSNSRELAEETEPASPGPGFGPLPVPPVTPQDPPAANDPDEEEQGTIVEEPEELMG
jgi:Flp pilus assembly protein CpaB